MEKREDLKENATLPQTSISGLLSDVVGGRDELLKLHALREALVREPENDQQGLLGRGMKVLGRTGEFFGGTVRDKNRYRYRTSGV
jgi:hypothetical protein